MVAKSICFSLSVVRGQLQDLYLATFGRSTMVAKSICVSALIGTTSLR